jgi:hypothetical protein
VLELRWGRSGGRGIPADGLTARLDARGEEGREGERERLWLGFIWRRSAVEREREVNSRRQTHNADRAVMTISGGGERLGRHHGSMARRGEASAGRGSGGAGTGAARGPVRVAWAASARYMAGEAVAGRWAEGKSEQSRAEGLEVDERTNSQFSKNIGTPL